MNKSIYQPLSRAVGLVLMAALVMALIGSPAQTAQAFASPATVNLGKAASFASLSKTATTTTGTTHITGNVGVSPIAASAITGFALIMDGSAMFSTSARVTGKIYAADYKSPTSINLTTAILNMQTAYTNAAGRAPNQTGLGAGNISGLTIAPGVYKWNTNVTINADVTLSGTATSIWIFQVAGDLTVANGKEVLLAGGAQAKNIFWQVGGGTGVTIGTTAHMEGTILAAKAIHLQTGASLNGRALSQTSVTLQANTLVIPVVSTFYVIYRNFLPLIRK